ncbi:hypothetical protein [Marinomonas hwangdonensis]|nr:hypothetical protein [Marinomonas hwangdonensis]
MIDIRQPIKEQSITIPMITGIGPDVAPAPHFKYQKIMTFKRWIEHEVKAIDSSWATYLKMHPEMSEVTV